MQVPTSFSSTVFLVGFEPRLPLAARSFEIDGREPARVGTVHLRGMAGRKRTIARLQQTVALPGSELRVLRNFESMIRIGVGQAGVCPVSQVSLLKLVALQRGVFLILEWSFQL